MKKIKLFALAVFAMLSTNVFAEIGEESATTVFRYRITADATAATPTTEAIPGEAMILGFVADYQIPTTAVEIPATVNHATNSGLQYKVTAIAAEAFENVAADFSFAKATNLVTINAGAFTGTKIATLDLTKTKVAEIVNIFGTVIAADETNVENKTLTTVKLPNAWTSISGTAFVNCTALTTVDFGTAPEFVDPTADEPMPFGPQTIDAGAFAKTAIGTLDLSKTKVVAINALFGTTIAAENAIKYSSLTTVKLPAAWTTIAENAFANCDKLETIDFGTVSAANLAAELFTQTINTSALAGTGVTALDFSKTKVTAVPNTLLYDGDVIKKNTSLATVTINKLMATEGLVNIGTAFSACEALTTFSGLDAKTTGEAPAAIFTKIPANAFKGDKLLATINTSTIAEFGASAFEGCAALTSIKLDAATTIGAAAFKESGLTAVEIPGTVGYINANTFKDCAALATVTFKHNTKAPEADGDPELQDFYGIGAYAFYGTAFTKITIPSTIKAGEETQDGKIGDRAFADSKVAEFTMEPTAPLAAGEQVNDNAFVGCDAVLFYTTEPYVEKNEVAPKKCTYKTTAAPVIVEDNELGATESKKTSQAGKYYVKFKNTTGGKIKVLTTDAKVYAAYLDADNKVLNMQLFKSNGGYYHIAANDVVLMLTNKAKVKYTASEIASAKGSSWVAVTGSEGAVDEVNQLKYVTDEAGQLRSDIEAEAPAATPDIYGWINSATYGYGFQKITSGKTFPQGTLYVLAAAPADGAEARVIWRDENGNIEDETTAIKGIVEAKAENGVIYNVAGQKVNASYKGLVIKDGKKYMKK
jgi:hypothetical protein